MEYAELKKALERIGLSSSEAAVYLALLKLGSSKAGEISKKCQINRTTTYDALKRLLEKGLISYVVKANRKWFEVADPMRLLEFLKEKEDSVKEILPILQEIYKMPKEKHSVTLYYGYKGMKSVFQDFIRSGGPIYVMDSEGQFIDRMPYFAEYFIREVEKNNVKIRHMVREGRDVKPSKTTEVRFITKKTKSDAAIDIYGDKVSVLIWTEPPEAVVIQNKTVADSLRDYFEMLWKNAKRG